MCSRFFIDAEASEKLRDILEEAGRRQASLTGENTVATGEVFPSQVAAALALGKSGRPGPYPMRWGFHRRDGKGLIINARSETAAASPLFAAPMRERRCLIPASWYYEWETRDMQQSLFETAEEPDPSLQVSPVPLPPARKPRNARKIKYAIRPQAPGLMWLAAVYRYEPGEKLPVFSILTREAAPGIAFIHSRMPVIFSEEKAMQWLDRSVSPQALLAACETDMISQLAAPQKEEAPCFCKQND